MSRHAWCTVALFLALAPTACQSFKPLASRPVLTFADDSSDALAAALREFADVFRSTVEAATSQTARLDLSPEQRKAVSTWGNQSAALLRHAYDQSDPREILLDVWSLCRRMVDYFATGPGIAEFGPARAVALAASQDLLARCEELAEAHTLSETLAQVRGEVTEYARAHPLRPGFVAPPARDLSDVNPGQQVLQWILKVPLAPLEGAQKFNQTSDALRDISRTADRFTNVVGDLPVASHREALALAEDLEKLPSVAATTQSVQQIAASTERFTQLVDELPARTRAETEQLLDRLDTSLPQARDTLTEAQKTTESIRAATAELRDALQPLDQTLSSFAEAGRAWRATADSVGTASRELVRLIHPTSQAATDANQPASAGTSGPDAIAGVSLVRDGAPTADITSEPPTTQPAFSFGDVTTSAEALTRTTVELRGLLADLQHLLASGALSGEAAKLTAPADQVVDRAGVTSRTLIDHAAWRAAQLLVLLAVLLVAYRFVAGVTSKRGLKRAD